MKEQFEDSGCEALVLDQSYPRLREIHDRDGRP
jgi:hypothetical protein